MAPVKTGDRRPVKQCHLNYGTPLCSMLLNMNYIYSQAFTWRRSAIFIVSRSIPTYRYCSIYYIFVVSRDGSDVIYQLVPCSIDTYVATFCLWAAPSSKNRQSTSLCGHIVSRLVSQANIVSNPRTEVRLQ